ncbi:transcriptional regulator [Nocardia cyriacigeorgica]|uniref:Transcriptional regulator n=1 Tax=Nocardia cyriacigeorgica TaxID=135487 RepID=A0A5R8PA48_9NOCA|nr:transcriptional regulator [Nocardia cyriacigeorgica]TLG04683.1 transcriptional regulator [Nocardia cyriacigeorgica]
MAVPVDIERVDAAEVGRVDAAAIDQYVTVNRALWAVYASARSKSAVFPAVREHSAALVDGLGRTGSEAVRRQLFELAAEAFQLAGEILFDGDRYADSAHCYTVAASLSKEAGAKALWACALTRRAYLDVYGDRAADAIPLLEAARHLAREGDPAMATRYWVDTVYAHALAGTGDAGWERAVDAAEDVCSIGPLMTKGWLRFNGARLDEERAACHIRLGEAGRAERLLSPLLEQQLSPRRRAGVLIDLSAARALNRDPVHSVRFGGMALDIARQTHSGYIVRRLEQLRPCLENVAGDPHVQHLDQQIATISMNRTVRAV